MRTTRLPRSSSPADSLELIDRTIETAREEFDDPTIDRQRVLELLIDQRLEDLKRDGGMEETRFSLFRGRSCDKGFEEVFFRWPVEYYEEFRRLGVEIVSARALRFYSGVGRSNDSDQSIR